MARLRGSLNPTLKIFGCVILGAVVAPVIVLPTVSLLQAVDTATTPAPPPPPLPTYTKQQFAALLYGMTKAEVRARFGSPDFVMDSNDSWYYSSLPIFDAEAGVQAPVWVRFTGFPGPDAEVAEVRY